MQKSTIRDHLISFSEAFLLEDQSNLNCVVVELSFYLYEPGYIIDLVALMSTNGSITAAKFVANSLVIIFLAIWNFSCPHNVIHLKFQKSQRVI